MKVCALAPSDAAAFQALRLRGLRECPEAFASSYEEEVGTPLGEIEKRLQPRNDSAIFGAFKDSELLALAGLQRDQKRFGEAVALQLDLERAWDADGDPDPYVFEELEQLYRALGDEARARHYADRLKAARP